MSYSFSDYVHCPDMQEALVGNFGDINPAEISKKTGVLDFVISDFNETGLLQNSIDTGNGHRRIVQLRYKPRMLESDIAANGARRNCIATNEYGETVTNYELDPDTEGWNHTWKITQALLEERCEADEAYFAAEMARQMGAFRRRIATSAVSQINAQVGNLAGGGAEITGVSRASGVLTENLLENIVYEYDLMQATTAPFVFGMGEISKYMTALRAGCCATRNIDLGAYALDNEIVFMKDDSVRTVLGVTKFLALVPGAVQMLRYNEFRGAGRSINAGIYRQETLVDPVNGLEYDFWMKFDCGVWHFGLKLAGKFVTLPTDIFFAEDELSGVNWVTKGTVTTS